MKWKWIFYWVIGDLHISFVCFSLFEMYYILLFLSSSLILNLLLLQLFQLWLLKLFEIILIVFLIIATSPHLSRLLVIDLDELKWMKLRSCLNTRSKFSNLLVESSTVWNYVVLLKLLNLFYLFLYYYCAIIYYFFF